MKVWQCVFWLSALTLHLAHSQSEWIKEALDVYNQKEEGEFYFKFLSELPESLLEEEGDSPAAGFLIMETECRKSDDADYKRCNYKKDGEMKLCALDQEQEEVQCVSMTEDVRTKRASENGNCNLLCKVKGKLKAVKQKIVSVKQKLLSVLTGAKRR